MFCFVCKILTIKTRKKDRFIVSEQNLQGSANQKQPMNSIQKSNQPNKKKRKRHQFENENEDAMVDADDAYSYINTEDLL